jgi:hypothetical protein
MTEPTKPREGAPDAELTDEQLDGVSGGLALTTETAIRPVPGGPVPIPYPNIATPTKE